MNFGEVDKRGRKITDKTTVIVSQYAQSIFTFKTIKNNEDLIKSNHINNIIYVVL